MEQTVARASAPSPVVFRDGFGDRRRIADPTTTDKLEVLCLRSELAAVPSFESALRERLTRLGGFQQQSFGRVRTVCQLNDAKHTLAVGSDATAGVRLSEILSNAERHQLAFDMDAALCLLRQLVPAMAALHEQGRDIAHGALGPERIVITPDARLVVVEYVLGSALDQLKFSHERFWRELRIACRPSAGSPALDHRTDVMQVGVVALSLVLGRLLHDSESPSTLGDLVASAWDHPTREMDAVPTGFRSWLSRALQLNLRDAFLSVAEAQRELDAVLGHVKPAVSSAALDAFLARYQEAVDRPASPVVAKAPLTFPTPIATIVPTPVAEVDTPAVAAVDAPMATDVETPVAMPVAPAIEPPIAMTTFVPEPIVEVPEPVFDAPSAPPLAVAAVESEPAIEMPPVESRSVRRDPEPVLAVDDITPFEPPSAGGFGWRKGLIAATVALACAGAGIPALRHYFSPAARAPQEGMLSITSNPAGAKLVIDGETRGVTPMTLTVKAGDHVLNLKGAGEPRTMTVTVAPGAQVSQYVELSPGKVALGSLQVRTESGTAQVSVDGVLRGPSPVTVADLAPGEHVVLLEGSTGSTKHTVTVEAGATASLVAQLTTAPSVSLPGWITVSAPSEVQLFENGRLLGSSQTDRLMVPAGSHALEIVNTTLGYRTTRTVQVGSDKVSTIKLEFPNGTIALNATPWADVWIDGAKVGQTPIGNLPVTIGSHEVIFRHPDLGEKRHVATVTLTAPARLSVDMRQK